MFNELNKTFESKFTATTEGKEFTTLEELFEANESGDGKHTEPIRVLGYFINTKSEYGDAPVAILDDALVSLPRNTVDTVRDVILVDDDMIAAINNGEHGIVLEKFFHKKYKKTCYSVKFVDL